MVVGSVYLKNYLAWRRLFETTKIGIKTWLHVALLAKQQPFQTSLEISIHKSINHYSHLMNIHEAQDAP